MSKWQPIETAPKHRQIILGLIKSPDYPEGYSSQGYWQEGWSDSNDEMGCDDGFVDCNFNFFSPPRNFGNPLYQSSGLQPTHWMPLPEPPK